jgi:hypothetical protein
MQEKDIDIKSVPGYDEDIAASRISSMFIDLLQRIPPSERNEIIRQYTESMNSIEEIKSSIEEISLHIPIDSMSDHSQLEEDEEDDIDDSEEEDSL